MGRVHNTKAKAFKAKGAGVTRQSWHSRRNPYSSSGRKAAAAARRHLTDEDFGEWTSRNYVAP